MPAISARRESRARHPARAARRLAVAGLAALALVLSGCATHPPATSLPRPVTHALPQDTPTPLRDALAAPERAHPGESGFRVLSVGTDALQMRIALARAATRTLDMQYYIATEDTTGKLLLAAALYAADRGVRVRMLVDDLNFKDIGQIMASLNAHPNIEIRVFNPFGATQRGMFARTADLVTKIDRFTRRMHNKAMIADNQLAIVGGRNLGDEYFSASPTLQFRDLDVLSAGPVTADISSSFDAYWASASAYPLRALNHQRFSPRRTWTRRATRCASTGARTPRPTTPSRSTPPRWPRRSPASNSAWCGPQPSSRRTRPRRSRWRAAPTRARRCRRSPSSPRRRAASSWCSRRISCRTMPAWRRSAR